MCRARGGRGGVREYTDTERKNCRGEIVPVARARAESGAPEYAPVEMAAARAAQVVASRKGAAADKDAQPATQLAEQADVDAQLAEATAQRQKSHNAAMEFDASMQTLRHESLRATQPTQ